MEQSHVNISVELFLLNDLALKFIVQEKTHIKMI